MADGEQQHQLVIAQLAIEATLAGRLVRLDRQRFVDQGDGARIEAQQIKGAMAGDRGEPRLGPVGHALERP